MGEGSKNTAAGLKAAAATDVDEQGGKWCTRGMLINTLGKDEVTRKINKGKWQVRYDSDEDSECLLPLHKSSRPVSKEESTEIKHSATGSSEDFKALSKALEQKHGDLLNRSFKQHRGSSTSIRDPSTCLPTES